MTERGADPWPVVAVLVVTVALTLGLLLATGGFVPATCAGGGVSPSCPLPPGGIHYASEEVDVVADAGVNVLTNVTFDGVLFQMWSPSPTSVEGTGTEPGGVDLAFLVLGGSSPANASSSPWVSPDGVFGVGWAGETSDTIHLSLLVSEPRIAYASEDVPVPSLTNLTWSDPAYYPFDGMGFVLQWVSGGFELNVTVISGTTSLHFGISVDLSPLTCVTTAGAAGSVLNRSYCLFNGEPDRGIAVLLGSSVVLMVRSP